MAHEKTYLVTTPIYYVNGRSHVGGLYSTVLADILARWQKLRGREVQFFTGTDEYGQKVGEAAARAGQKPYEYVSVLAQAYQETWKAYSIDYTQFVRTTSEQHILGVHHFIKHAMQRGDIYLGAYQGWYCTPCETFVADDVEIAPNCPTCSRQTHKVSEESYFFRLSKYQDRLLSWYKENPDWIQPRERLCEVISFVESGLKDLSISRTSVSWGIPFPGDNKHTVYVWADALMNYVTACGYGSGNLETMAWWPADVQVMGKDIVRFHAIIWPAFLMSAELALPKKLLVHGWLKIGDQKMSKSLGNAVDPLQLRQVYGADEVRYYLARYMAVTQDSPFSLEDLEHRITTDLANDLGNLVNRLAVLVHKIDATGTIVAPAQWAEREQALRQTMLELIAAWEAELRDGMIHRAYGYIQTLVQKINSYIHEQEPWRVMKTDQVRAREILSATCHALRAALVALSPVMPEKMEIALQLLGQKLVVQRDMNILAMITEYAWGCTFTVQVGQPLFKKYLAPILSSHVKGKDGIDSQALSTTSGNSMIQELSVQENNKSVSAISLDEFLKAHLVVGTIKQVATVDKSDKLYALRVDCGSYGERQICSGVRTSFTPEELLGKQAVFILNLPPRMLMGIPSEGMLLCARREDGLLSFTTISSAVPNGTRLS